MYSQLDDDLLDCSLVLDAMSIRKYRFYDVQSGSELDFIDYGSAAVEDPDRLACEALVFLLIPFCGSMKFPIAYFLCEQTPSQVQAELIRTALTLTATSGIQVRNVTCDGCSSNIATLHLLGCSLDPRDPKVAFHHPSFDYDVYASLDICHILKLARNALASMDSFVTSDNQQISWGYIRSLGDLWQLLGLKFANKLSSPHLQ